MTIELTPQQLEVLDSGGMAAPRVIDPRTNTPYVLISEADYGAFRDLLEDEQRQQHIHAAALRNAAGRMDESP